MINNAKIHYDDNGKKEKSSIPVRKQMKFYTLFEMRTYDRTLRFSIPTNSLNSLCDIRVNFKRSYL